MRLEMMQFHDKILSPWKQGTPYSHTSVNQRTQTHESLAIMTILLLFGMIFYPVITSGISSSNETLPMNVTVELSDSVGATSPLGDLVLTGYSANYTANENVAAVERDVLLPVETLPRDENFLPESRDNQYFVAWLESDETSWEPHSHLLNDAHALMWLKGTEQGIIGPEPGSVLTSGQQYGFIASHGSMSTTPPAYLPNGTLKGEPFIEIAGPVVTETQGVSNTGASDLVGVVVSGFMGFSGGDYDVGEMGAASVMDSFTLPEISSRSGDNYAYTWAWIRPVDTEVSVDFVMDFETHNASVIVNATDGFFKQARELEMPGGYVQRYWGVAFSLYLYFFPPHQGSDEGLTPHSRLLWPFDDDMAGEMRTRGPDWYQEWSGLSKGFGLEMSGKEVIRVFDSDVAEVSGEPTGDFSDKPMNENEEDEEQEHLTGAGVLTYNLSTDYLGQGYVALTNITPFGQNESLVDAWGFSSLQIEGEDVPMASEWLVDHSALTGVWVFGMSIGWIWVSPTLQNGANPALKSDSWWWFHSPGGSTIGMVYKVRDEVLVLARIMIRPMEGFADIVIEAGAYTLDGDEKEMKLWQHLDPSVIGEVTYTDAQQNEEFGPNPVGDGEDMEVTGSDGRSIRWLAQDTGGGFCIVDHGELTAHPSQEADGEAITNEDIRFYLEHRNFGEEFYRAYAVYADSQFRIRWGDEAPNYDISLVLIGHSDEIEEDGTLSVDVVVTNNGDTPIMSYVWMTVDGHPAVNTIIQLDPGESEEVALEFSFGELKKSGYNMTHHWTNFSMDGKHDVVVEAFPLGGEDAAPEDNVVSCTVEIGEEDEGFFGSSEGFVYSFLVIALLILIIGGFVMMRNRGAGKDEEEEDYWDDEGEDEVEMEE